VGAVGGRVISDEQTRRVDARCAGLPGGPGSVEERVGAAVEKAVVSGKVDICPDIVPASLIAVGSVRKLARGSSSVV